MASKPPPIGHSGEHFASAASPGTAVDPSVLPSLDVLVPAIYDELRGLARQQLRREREGHTLDTTALVHEAYLRLLGQHLLPTGDRVRFFAVAATTMRRVLVDYARARNRQKRGGAAQLVPLSEAGEILSERAAEEAIELDEALRRLQEVSPRAATIFEQRLFAGLGVAEIAGLLGISEKTVQRDWEAARAWLRKEVSTGLGPVPTP